MPVITKAQAKAIEWLRARGGSAAIAKTSAGGRIFLAQGETGPFTFSTVKQLEQLGLVEKCDGRIQVKP